jgi:23S rRNA U2552 (ribose-2'-O)-methylase RlmE/FtsJ
MSNIIDIINTEEAIGAKMIDGSDIKKMAIFSGVSKLFNKIVKNDMETQRNKYIKRQILVKTDVIITNKMYSMIKEQGNRRGIYKTLEEYEEDLRELTKQINIKIYDDIISDLYMIHREYIFDGSITNSCYEAYLFGIMETEYSKFIEYLEKDFEISI